MTENVEVVEQQAEAAPATEVKDQAAPPEAETPDGKDEESNKEGEADAKKFAQKDVDEIVQKRLARESRKLERQIRAELENKVLRQQLAERDQPKAEQPSGEPKPEQFKDYESYIDALTDYKLEKKLESVREQEARANQQKAQQSYESTIRDNLNKAADKYDDFEEVVTNPDLSITAAMRDAIGESEKGGDIAYYLGTHPDEAAKIAQLSPVQQVKAIDRLEAKFTETPKQQSKAPAPMEPVKGKPKSADNLESMSLDDYMKARAKQGARWSR